MLDAVRPIDVDADERPVRPYGSWPSPISVAVAVAGSRGLAEVRPDGRDVLFLESRPDQGGRVALVRLRAVGGTEEAVPQDLNVRTRVHQYGGGAYTVRDGVIVLSEHAGNRLLVTGGRDSRPRTLVDEPALRFADMEVDPGRQRVLAVLEDQRSSAQDPRNLVVAVSLLDGSLTELAAGHDFYSDPRLDRTGSRIAFLTWDRPCMPWDGSDLWVADVQPDGRLGLPFHVAGGPDESIVQPTWAPDGSLVFVSDRSGWWNLYRWRKRSSDPVAVAPMDAEMAGPQWVFGQRWFDIAADGTIVAVASDTGVDTLHVLAAGEEPREVPLDATSVTSLRVVDGAALCVLGSPTRPSAVARIDLASGRVERLHEANRLPVDETWLSRPRHLTFPSARRRRSHAWYYPPTNPDASAPDGELPPLVVMSHGGPTSSARTTLSLERQAFTSRGFAVVDVDYGGSTGYGREYRALLDGSWGIVDVEDCVNAALWLAKQGLVDRDRLAIRGASAGGFTTLAALCFRPDVFAAGTSYFGVGDLEALELDTHKFESKYSERLVAPYPEQAEVYRKRSPINFVDAIRCPVLVLQGSDDLVVPPAQAEALVAALERNDVPRAYLLFEGEAHGFRQAVNQRRALEAELSFYAQVFGFELADEIEPIVIDGWPQAPGARVRSAGGDGGGPDGSAGTRRKRRSAAG
jgi:dipeptidyl aminopeptidase/acylaminoacyl peptidase